MTDKLMFRGRFASLVILSFLVSGCVMGEIIGDAAMRDPLRSDRDSGVIGEKKTIRPTKVQYEESTGSTFRFADKGNFATPQVIGSVAKFDSGAAFFEFGCLDWKYRTQNYWSSADETAERIAPAVNLESPDKQTLVYVHLVDLPVGPPLDAHSMTQEQERIAQEEGSVYDPFVGEESLVAAQQAVKWYLSQNLNGHIVSEKGMPTHFVTENISGKEFVKVEFDVLDKKKNLTKKGIVWACNYRAFWLHNGNRHIWTWICQIITDSSEYPSVIAKARQIPETAEFKKYIPNNRPRKRVPGVRYLNYRGEVIQ